MFLSQETIIIREWCSLETCVAELWFVCLANSWLELSFSRDPMGWLGRHTSCVCCVCDILVIRNRNWALACTLSTTIVLLYFPISVHSAHEGSYKVKKSLVGQAFTTEQSMYECLGRVLTWDAKAQFQLKAIHVGSRIVTNLTQEMALMTAHIFPTVAYRDQKQYQRRVLMKPPNMCSTQRIYLLLI